MPLPPHFMIQITRGRTYRHTSCLDVDMHIVAIRYLGPDYFKLKVVWVSQRDPNIFWEQPGQVKLYRKHLKNWSLVR